MSRCVCYSIPNQCMFAWSSTLQWRRCRCVPLSFMPSSCHVVMRVAKPVGRYCTGLARAELLARTCRRGVGIVGSPPRVNASVARIAAAMRDLKSCAAGCPPLTSSRAAQIARLRLSLSAHWSSGTVSAHPQVMILADSGTCNCGPCEFRCSVRRCTQEADITREVAHLRSLPVLGDGIQKGNAFRAC